MLKFWWRDKPKKSMEGPIKHTQFKVEGHDKPGKFMEGGIKCLTVSKAFAMEIRYIAAYIPCSSTSIS